MRVVVTGAAGFIGSALVRQLLQPAPARISQDNVKVVALDSLIRTASWRALGPVTTHPDLTLIVASILDSRAVAKSVAQADVVIHCAAETSVDASFARESDFVATNLDGSGLVAGAAAAAGVGTFVHFSTDEVYGPIDHGSAHEGFNLNPTNPYARSKADSESIISAAASGRSMRVVVVRPSNNYGPWQMADNLIPRFVTMISRGERAPLYGSGEHRRCWVHVDDTVSAVLRLVRNHDARGVFNIAGEELSNLDVTAHILRCLNADWSSVQRVPGRPVNDIRYCSEESRLRNLGYVRKRRFSQQIASVVEHYRRQALAL